MENEVKRCGFVAIIGRPNVGKSTLLNRILGKKVSITSRKPQTTRDRILGIKTTEDCQYIYVDSPGLHRRNETLLNRQMNQIAEGLLQDVDIIVCVLDATRQVEQDQSILQQVSKTTKQKIMVLNKVDKLAEKARLLPLMEALAEEFPDMAIIPVSAKSGDNVAALEAKILEFLPVSSVFYYPPEQVSDRDDKFFIAEIIREKLFRLLGQELPYALAVTIETLEDKDNLLSISALIWVNKDSQKAIVIGLRGEKLKAVGTSARVDLERHFAKKVFLHVWVKVKENWFNDKNSLGTLGYRFDQE